VNPKDDGSPPNNWLSVFGGQAWEWDQPTGQYYLHSFLKEQPDLNWRNPKVKEAIFDVVRFWLDRGVDGFRIDVAHYIMKDPQMRDNPPNPTSEIAIHKPLGDYDTQIHLHDKGHQDVHRAYREFRNILDNYSQERPRMSMGEIHIFNWEEWVTYYGKNLDEIHLPVNFTLLGAAWEAEQVRNLVEELESALPDGAWPNYVLGNHDDHRISSRYGPDQSRIAAMLLLTLRGTPILYYGDEIGMHDVVIPPHLEQDPAGLRQPGQGRDPNRTPMQWSGAEMAGFSPPGTENTWLPLAEDYQEINVEDQINRSDSMLRLYQDLIKIRKEHPALQSGRYYSIPDTPKGCFLYQRENEQECILIGLNFTDQPCSIDPDLTAGGILLLSTHNKRNHINTSLQSLEPNEGVLIQL
jgi:glycosidase